MDLDIEEIKKRVKLVMKETNYKEDYAKRKLQKHNYDTTACIIEYLETQSKLEHYSKIMFRNQRIYQQLRQQMGIIK